MAKEVYLNREDVLKILKISDKRLDALIKEGKLQEKEEGRFKEEDIIMHATEYLPDLEEDEEEIKILPSIEESVKEEKEEETGILAPHEKVAIEEKEVLPPIEELTAEEEKEEEIAGEEPMPAVDERLRIEPTELEDKTKVEPKVEAEREEAILFESRELAAPRKSPFFIFLSLFSLVIVLVSMGILALPVLGIAIPEFMKPAVDFVSGLL